MTDKKSCQWPTTCREAFLDLKKRLITSPILIPNSTKIPSWLHTEYWCKWWGFRSCFFFVVDGRKHVVAYASRVLSRTEKKYCATRREMLALVWATRHFWPYLYGRPFILRTDHSSLRWLHNFKESEGQVARWRELLSEFQYRVIYRPGAQHINHHGDHVHSAVWYVHKWKFGNGCREEYHNGNNNCVWEFFAAYLVYWRDQKSWSGCQANCSMDRVQFTP